jgi:hypothetical protein
VNAAVGDAAPLLLRERLASASTRRSEPFPLLIADGLLAPAAMQELLGDFPAYRGAGFFPYEPADAGPMLRRLVDELSSPEFADAVGDSLGLPGLARRPLLVTLCRSLNRRHGRIHTDSESKLATALLYLNPDWIDGSTGCLRFLASGTDLDALLAPEIRPVYGQFAVFARSPRSFHGHLPYEGQRYAIQLAWLRDEADRDRKIRRGRVSRALKWLVGRIDGRFGRRG